VTVDKRYQVYISTTYPDMQSARQALMLPLLDLGLMPMGMDMHSGESHNLMPVVQRMIDDSDYFVILLGGRYGTLSPLGLSYTHREYIFAATKRKPVVSFIHDDPLNLPPDIREPTREGQVRRDDFARLLENKTLSFRWRDESDLRERVARVMPDVMRQYPAPGWVQAGAGGIEDPAGRDLRRRVTELEKEREELLAAQRGALRNLARGTDPVALDYSCNVYEGGDCKMAMASCTLDWNRIFACVAPLMLNPVSEPVMQKALEDYIARQALENVGADFPKAHAVRNVVLAGHAFNQVKVQLRTLGLITKTSETDSRGLPLWRLTAQGDATMSQTMARRRG
tara:strand:- start:23381 stop:24400 length:1020 start_codon:yes stop_codon:yes gene_type:complete